MEGKHHIPRGDDSFKIDLGNERKRPKMWPLKAFYGLTCYCKKAYKHQKTYLISKSNMVDVKQAECGRKIAHHKLTHAHIYSKHLAYRRTARRKLSLKMTLPNKEN